MSKVILTFDDGRKDNYYIVKNILERMQIPATFFITTSYVKGYSVERTPCNNASMTQEQIEDIASNVLFEIAGHGREHQNDFSNLKYGLDDIFEFWKIKAVGISSPNTRLHFDDVTKNKEQYNKIGVKYVRLGRRTKNNTFVKKILFRVNRIVHSKYITRYVFKESFIEDNDSFVYPSIPIVNGMKSQEIISLMEYAIKKNKSIVFMLHSICKKNDEFYNDLYSYDYDEFVKICTFLKKEEKNKNVTLCKMKEIV